MTKALSNIAAESPHPHILMVECQLLTFSPLLKPSSPSSLWHLDDVSIRVLRWARRRNADSLEVSLQKRSAPPAAWDDCSGLLFWFQVARNLAGFFVYQIQSSSFKMLLVISTFFVLSSAVSISLSFLLTLCFIDIASPFFIFFITGIVSS